MLNFRIKGEVWKLGDNISTDIIIAGPYLTLRKLDEMASHVLEEAIPEFAKKVKKDAILVAGKNFGCGSSREIAPVLLKHLKVGAIVAESFARIFFRNAINIGLPVIECKEISSKVENGHQLEVNLANGEIKNLSTGETYHGTRLPSFMLEIIEAGGALEALKRKMKK